MKKFALLTFIVGFLISCQPSPHQNSANNNNFSFVFMTDVHVAPERHATEGFLQAIDTINKLAPDFVISGGDNIMDALGQTYGRADSLYNLFEETVKNLTMPIYYTMGNHEVFGLYKDSGVSPDHKEYGKKLYENRLAKRYYSFDHKNWHFIVLDGLGFTENRRYRGFIDSVQVEWLKRDLEKTVKNKPVVISIHIPLLRMLPSKKSGNKMKKSSTIPNAPELRKLFRKYNVQLVLQGHAHIYSDIYEKGIHYIIGGAICGNGWKGAKNGTEEGFLLINVSGENFTTKYIDYGWEVK